MWVAFAYNFVCASEIHSHKQIHSVNVLVHAVLFFFRLRFICIACIGIGHPSVCRTAMLCNDIII